MCAARTDADIEATAATSRAHGRRGLAVPTDVTVTEGLQRARGRAPIDEFGRLDILVNNAGGWLPRPVLETSERAFEAALRFNVTAAFLLTQLAVPHLAAHERARSSTSLRARRAWCSRCSSRTRPRRPHCR